MLLAEPRRGRDRLPSVPESLLCCPPDLERGRLSPSLSSFYSGVPLHLSPSQASCPTRSPKTWSTLASPSTHPATRPPQKPHSRRAGSSPGSLAPVPSQWVALSRQHKVTQPHAVSHDQPHSRTLTVTVMVTDVRTVTHRGTHAVTWCHTVTRSPTVTGPLARPLQPRKPAEARAHPRRPHRLLPAGRHLPPRRRQPGAERPPGRGGASLSAGPAGSQRGRGARAGSGAGRRGRWEMESGPGAAQGILGLPSAGAGPVILAPAPSRVTRSPSPGPPNPEPRPDQPRQADRSRPGLDGPVRSARAQRARSPKAPSGGAEVRTRRGRGRARAPQVGPREGSWRSRAFRPGARRGLRRGCVGSRAALAWVPFLSFLFFFRSFFCLISH